MPAPEPPTDQLRAAFAAAGLEVSAEEAERAREGVLRLKRLAHAARAHVLPQVEPASAFRPAVPDA
ncbi:MAG: hypothetical protein ACRDHX_18075 [Chloroflexota bacterium]